MFLKLVSYNNDLLYKRKQGNKLTVTGAKIIKTEDRTHFQTAKLAAVSRDVFECIFTLSESLFSLADVVCDQLNV